MFKTDILSESINEELPHFQKQIQPRKYIFLNSNQID